MINKRVNLMHSKWNSILLVFALVSPAILLIPYFGMYCLHPEAVTDPAIYAYVARAWLGGTLPYSGVWDQKGPFIFELYAVGAYLSSLNLVGVFILAWASLSGSVMFLWLSVRRLMGDKAAAVACLAFLICQAGLIVPGTEEDFGNTLILLAFYVVLLISASNSSRSWVLGNLALGASMACVLWMRPNMVTPYAGFLVTLVVSNVGAKGSLSKLGAGVLSFVVGFGATTVSILLPFIRNGKLNEVWQTVFVYNIHYSAVPITAKLSGGLWLMMYFMRSGGTMVLLLGIGVLAWRKWVSCAVIVAPTHLWTGTVVGMTFTLGSACLSGRHYPHYAVPLAVYVALFAGLTWVSFKPFENRNSRVAFAPLAVGVLFFTIALRTIVARQKHFGAADQSLVEVTNSIRSSTSPNDSMYVWGDYIGLYISSGRHAPGRFFASLHLAPEGFAEDTPEELAHEWATDMPKIIVDPHGTLRSIVTTRIDTDPTLPSNARHQAIFDLIRTSYTVGPRVGTQTYVLRSSMLSKRPR